MNKPIRILVADNNLEFLQHFSAFVEQQDGISIVSSVRDGQGAVAACKEVLPDLALIDLHLPVLDSIRAIKTIVGDNEHLKVLGISAIPGDRYALEAVKAGARGYVKKNGPASFATIVAAIRQMVGGEVVIDPELAASILQEFS